MFLPDAGARSRGIHVAEQTLCSPKGNATTSVTHLETKITVSLRNLFAYVGVYVCASTLNKDIHFFQSLQWIDNPISVADM